MEKKTAPRIGPFRMDLLPPPSVSRLVNIAIRQLVEEVRRYDRTTGQRVELQAADVTAPTIATHLAKKGMAIPKDSDAYDELQWRCTGPF